MYSVLIRGAKVIDGSGNPWYHADIAIDGERIAAIGALGGARADLTIDAAGLVAAPGFIDIHTHSDLPLLQDGEGNAHIRQGVTTNVIGNCGSSVAPVTDSAVEYLRQSTAAGEPALEWDWRYARPVPGPP